MKDAICAVQSAALSLLSPSFLIRSSFHSGAWRFNRDFRQFLHSTLMHNKGAYFSE
jgi:hypothetical protein